MYLLALIVLLVAIALLCVWRLWLVNASGGNATPTATATASPRPGATELALDATIAPTATSGKEASSGVNTVVYYQDNYGYLVPVMMNVPLEEGIAKATLSMMVKSSANDMQAARLGLRTVIPESVAMDLDISGGKARIDLSKESLNLADAAAEQNMINAIVQTLTEFDTVQSVEFLFGGQKMEKLKFGTDVSGAFTRGDVNLETTSVETSANGAMNKLTLYFPGESGSVVVPVTRMVYSEADINTAVLELTKGPLSGALGEVAPEGCGLIGVTVEGGLAKVNFTKEFMQIVNNVDGGRIALKALVLTCTQFDGVDSVQILVDGEPYDPGVGTLSVPSFANVAGDIESDYIQTQSSAIFGDD
jgi:germination protein M